MVRLAIQQANSTEKPTRRKANSKKSQHEKRLLLERKTPPMTSALRDVELIDGQLRLSEPIYRYTARLTEVTEFGQSLTDVLFGAVPPPPGGLRCDASFEGPVTGPRLWGTVKGTDFGNLRADGRAELHIHAHITTTEGKVIALDADGVSYVEPGSPVAQLRENVTLTSSHPEHAWMNALQIWAIGTADFGKGEIEVSAYAV
jgi:hypothetical protein